MTVLQCCESIGLIVAGILSVADTNYCVIENPTGDRREFLDRPFRLSQMFQDPSAKRRQPLPEENHSVKFLEVRGFAYHDQCLSGSDVVSRSHILRFTEQIEELFQLRRGAPGD